MSPLQHIYTAHPKHAQHVTATIASTCARRELRCRPKPWCVLGDLNLRPDLAVPLLGEAGLAPVESAPTYPAHAPQLRIDWIALSGLSVAGSQVIDTGVSDHRALAIDVADPSALAPACRSES